MLDHSTEEWRDVVGYEGWYEVSDLGRVRRVRAAPGARPGHILKPYFRQNGYCQVRLSSGALSTQRGFGMHDLVCRAFHGPPPTPKHEVNHKDGDKWHNVAENLEWLTPSANRLHALNVLGRQAVRGERHPRAKLTEEDVREIRCATGTQREIAQRYGVTQSLIWLIKARTIWRHVM